MLAHTRERRTQFGKLAPLELPSGAHVNRSLSWPETARANAKRRRRRPKGGGRESARRTRALAIAVPRRSSFELAAGATLAYSQRRNDEDGGGDGDDDGGNGGGGGGGGGDDGGGGGGGGGGDNDDGDDYDDARYKRERARACAGRPLAGCLRRVGVCGIFLLLLLVATRGLVRCVWLESKWWLEANDAHWRNFRFACAEYFLRSRSRRLSCGVAIERRSTSVVVAIAAAADCTHHRCRRFLAKPSSSALAAGASLKRLAARALGVRG